MSRLTDGSMIATGSAKSGKSHQGRSKLIWTIAAVSVAVCTWYLLDSGFCFSQMRYVSDKELIVEAIRYNADNMKIDGTDASIEDFLKKTRNAAMLTGTQIQEIFLGRWECFWASIIRRSG